MKTRRNALSLALGTSALVGTLAATPIASANANPFTFSDLGNGYMVADAEGSKAKKDGSCGESKCGDKKAKKVKKSKDGSCGESKCGDKKADKSV
ncbi:HvfA family oxazolone/thioamide-modified RiPP metallophore [Kaarinaea lacus]